MFFTICSILTVVVTFLILVELIKIALMAYEDAKDAGAVSRKGQGR